MSWGRSTSGTAAAVLAAVIGWPAQVLEDDTKHGQSPEVAQLHQGEAAKVVQAVQTALEGESDDVQFSVSGGGHCSIRPDGTIAADAWNVNITRMEPAKPIDAGEGPE